MSNQSALKPVKPEGSVLCELATGPVRKNYLYMTLGLVLGG